MTKYILVLLLFLSTNSFADQSCVIVRPVGQPTVQTYSTDDSMTAEDKQKHFVVGTIGFVACDAILTNYLEHSKWTCAGLGLLAMIAKEKTDDKFSTPDIAAGMAGVGLGAAIRFNF
jgi:hypothetical protein